MAYSTVKNLIFEPDLTCHLAALLKVHHIETFGHILQLKFSVLQQNLLLPKSKDVVFREKNSLNGLGECNTHFYLFFGRGLRWLVIDHVAPFDHMLRVLHSLYLFLNFLLISWLILEAPLHLGPIVIINQVILFVPFNRQLIYFLFGLLRHRTPEAILT